jgi:hypothetical protein
MTTLQNDSPNSTFKFPPLVEDPELAAGTGRARVAVKSAVYLKFPLSKAPLIKSPFSKGGFRGISRVFRKP